MTSQLLFLCFSFPTSQLVSRLALAAYHNLSVYPFLKFLLLGSYGNIWRVMITLKLPDTENSLTFIKTGYFCLLALPCFCNRVIMYYELFLFRTLKLCCHFLSRVSRNIRTTKPTAIVIICFFLYCAEWSYVTFLLMRPSWRWSSAINYGVRQLFCISATYSVAREGKGRYKQ